jgi:transposase
MGCSEDLRRRVLKAVEQGATRKEAAKRFGVGVASVYRWQKQPQAERTGPRTAHTINMQALADHVRNQPDALLVERAEAFGVSHVGVWKALRRLGMSKKNVAVR